MIDVAYVSHVIHPAIVRAKFRAMSEGARLASRRLWKH